MASLGYPLLVTGYFLEASGFFRFITLHVVYGCEDDAHLCIKFARKSCLYFGVRSACWANGCFYCLPDGQVTLLFRL